MSRLRIEESGFGTLNGRQARCFTLSSGSMEACLCDYGCTLTGLTVNDRNGAPVNTVLGYADVSGYALGSSCIGAVVGRYAGRISGAGFELNGRRYFLEANDGPNHLHGGFSKRFWSAEQTEKGVRFTLTSPDMDEGFPGELCVAVTYEVEGSVLRIIYEAETDADTVLNLTNHSYFNLLGEGDVLSHTLRVNSGRYAELGEGMIPTGRLLPVDGTPLDHTCGRALITVLDSRLEGCGGIDHSFALPYDGGRREAGELYCGQSGIRLLCRTTQPVLHIYTGNYVDLDSVGVDRCGRPFVKHGGVCFETQHFPDSPNRPEFPSTLLRAGERFREVTEFELITE